MKKNIVALCFVLFAALCASFYFITDFLIKQKSDELINLTIEKTRSAVNISVLNINKSIESSDDIALLSNIDNLAKYDSINSCFILDRDNKVIIHNNTNDWNQVRKSEQYDRAINYDGQLVQTTPDKDHLLFSKPIAKDYTLFCIISIEKASETVKIWRIKYYAAAAATAFVITFVVYLFAKLFILIPFNRTKRRLENANGENIKNEKYDEISDLFLSERKKFEDKISSLEEENKNLALIIKYFLLRGKETCAAAIALNGANNIICAYDKTEKILKKDFSVGDNIIEALLNPDLLKIISKAAETPNGEIAADYGEIEIKAFSVSDGEKISGTILTAATQLSG
ncbi:MAG: hypothetical protein LBO62_02640 [Endomicrobium sp.]|jgi:hypothetical protein|nr:hypothetical protein [Endomicrobium sp.]